MATLRLLRIVNETSKLKEHHLVDEENQVIVTWTEENRVFSPTYWTIYAGPKETNQIFCTIRRSKVSYNGVTKRGGKFLHNQKKTAVGKALAHRRSFYTPDGKEYQWKADRWKESDKTGHLALLPVPRNPHDQPIVLIDKLAPEIKKQEKAIPKSHRKIRTLGIMRISSKSIAPYTDYDPSHALIAKGLPTPLFQSALVALACIVIREADEDRGIAVGAINRKIPLSGVGFTFAKGDGITGLQKAADDEGYKPVKASGFSEYNGDKRPVIQHFNSRTSQSSDSSVEQYATSSSPIYFDAQFQTPEVKMSRGMGWSLKA